EAARLRSFCSAPVRGPALKPELFPYVNEGTNEIVDVHVLVIGRWRNTQPFRSSRDSREVDWLDIDAVFCQQPIAGGLALVGTADQQGKDMRFRGHDRQPSRAKCGLCLGDAILVALALPV